MKPLTVICRIAALVLGGLPALTFVGLMATAFAGVSSNWGACAVLGLAGLIAAFYRFDFEKPGFRKKFCAAVGVYLLAVWAVILLSLPKFTYTQGLTAVQADSAYTGCTVTENAAEKTTSGLLKPKPTYFISSYYIYRAEAADGTVRYIVFDPVDGKSGFCEDELITALAGR